MKRLLSLLLIFISLSLGVSAQTGLEINQIFGGKYVSDPSVTETLMNGNQKFLTKHNLNTLATFRGNSQTYGPILQPLVLADGSKAIGRNVRYKEGKLQYAYFILPSITVNGKKVNRYLYYLNNENGKKPSAMVIYFDGKISRDAASELIRALSK
ncbi:MAG: DUF6108 family protein [Staphylococcus sp.]|nr:DUF6108 family protein [Staphylococcus sp.]